MIGLPRDTAQEAAVKAAKKKVEQIDKKIAALAAEKEAALDWIAKQESEDK